jgi:hypothetical protein
MPLPPLPSLSFATVIIVTTAALSVTATDFAAQCRYHRCRLCCLPQLFPLPLLPSPTLPLNAATAAAVYVVCHHHLCRCRLFPLRLRQTSTSGQPVQAMDLLSEGTASVTDDKIQTTGDREGNDGNKQR